ncbi:MAG: hypothetical protein DRJ62_07630, partial [Thermoprotei archaeon]
MVTPIVVAKLAPPISLTTSTQTRGINKLQTLLKRISKLLKINEEELDKTYEVIINKTIKDTLMADPKHLADQFNKGLKLFTIYCTSLLSYFSAQRIYVTHLEAFHRLLREIRKIEKKIYSLYIKLIKEKSENLNISLEDLEYA